MASKKKRKAPAPPKPAVKRKAPRHLMPREAGARRPGGRGGRTGIEGWLYSMGARDYGPRDWGTLGLLALGLLIVGYFAFSAGGYFVIRRGYGELILLWLIVVGLLFELQMRDTMPNVGRIELGLFSGYVLWILLSVGWSIAPSESFDEFVRGALYIAGFGLFYLYLARREWLGWLGHLFVVVVAVVALDALLGKTFPEIIDHPDPFRSNRINYPITYWNTMAVFMIMGFIIGLRALADRTTHVIARAVYAPALLLFLVVLWFTSSRAGILLLMMSLGLYLLLAQTRLRAVMQTALLGAWTAVIVAVSYAYLPNMVASVPDERFKTSEGHKLALAILIFMVVAAVSQFVVRWLEGRVNISVVTGKRIGYALAGGVAVFFVAVILLFTSTGGRGGPVSFVKDQLSGTTETEQAVDRPSDRLLSLKSERFQEYGVSVTRFKEQPLNGFGAGTWSVAWLKHRPWDIQVKDGHSWLFETLAELGLVGTVLLLAFVCMFFFVSIRDLRFLGKGRDREIYGAFFTVCAAFLLHAMIDWDWEMPVITLTFFMFAGGLLRYGMLARAEAAPAAAAENVTTRKEIEEGRTGISRVLGVNWLIGAGCLLAMVATIVPLVANSRIQSATQAAQRQDYATTEREAAKAASWNPLDAEPLVLQAVANQARGRNSEAARLLEEAARKEPENDGVLRNLTRVYLQLHSEAVARGDKLAQDDLIAKIDEVLTKARALNPLEARETGTLEIEFRKIGGVLE